MSGKARPSLRKKTLERVRYSNLSNTDKACIEEVFRRMDALVLCKDCVHYKAGKYFTDINFCQRLPYYAEKGGLNTADDDFCSYGERRDSDEN